MIKQKTLLILTSAIALAVFWINSAKLFADEGNGCAAIFEVRSTSVMVQESFPKLLSSLPQQGVSVNVWTHESKEPVVIINFDPDLVTKEEFDTNVELFEQDPNNRFVKTIPSTLTDTANTIDPKTQKGWISQQNAIGSILRLFRRMNNRPIEEKVDNTNPLFDYLNRDALSILVPSIILVHTRETSLVSFHKNNFEELVGFTLNRNEGKLSHYVRLPRQFIYFLREPVPISKAEKYLSHINKIVLTDYTKYYGAVDSDFPLLTISRAYRRANPSNKTSTNNGYYTLILQAKSTVSARLENTTFFQLVLREGTDDLVGIRYFYQKIEDGTEFFERILKTLRLKQETINEIIAEFSDQREENIDSRYYKDFEAAKKLDQQLRP